MDFRKQYFLFMLMATVLLSISGKDTTLKGDKCAYHDMCGAAKEFHTCSCDEDCYLYGTCCTDAHNSKTPLSDQIYHCHSEMTATPVFAKFSCSKEFKGHPGVVRACLEEDVDKADLQNYLLVSSRKSKTTYWNINCAICNNEEDSDLDYWTVRVSCPLGDEGVNFNETYVRHNLIFSEVIHEWGLTVKDGFVTCDIKFFQPAGMAGLLQYCAPNMTTSCPQNFTNKHFAAMCSSYHGERKHKETNEYYRNVYCALCNGVTLKELECVERKYAIDDSIRIQDPISVFFTLGSWIESGSGGLIKCSSEYMFDPFQKRCRRRETEENVIASHSIRSRTSLLCVVFLLMHLFF